MKTILITGASSGIGAQTARALAPGNKIYIHYHASERSARDVAGQVEALGGEAVLICADVSKKDSCREMIEEIRRSTDHLDVLVNNAGGLVERKMIEDYDWDHMVKTFSLNTFSVMMITSLCLPLLKRGSDPSIVNVSSITVRNGAASATSYGASKGAIDVFTRGAAAELAPLIRVNAVAPGIILTRFHETTSTPEDLQKIADSSPLQRNGRVEDVASAISFLIENTFITGETIDINGGRSMR